MFIIIINKGSDIQCDSLEGDSNFFLSWSTSAYLDLN